jgi:hypothetical protein
VTTADRDAYAAALEKARQAFQSSTNRLYEIRQEQTELEGEIANLRKTITALSAMCSQDPGIDKLGITDSVTTVMIDTKWAWSTGEVVNALDAMGFDLSSQKNVQASVHAVLTRLAQRGTIGRIPAADVKKKDSDGKPLEWVGPNYDPDDDIPF